MTLTPSPHMSPPDLIGDDDASIQRANHTTPTATIKDMAPSKAAGSRLFDRNPSR